mmetsp:Transcript_38276/g.114601  ORF Transcript_38276/g.114601 Transcript_38276/m.114601 type:complete len:303 (+) Transcript_38276:3868-4776(+)
MSVVGPDGVHLDVRTLCFNKFFVYVTPVPPHLVDLGVELGRTIPHLSEQFLAPSPRAGGVVDRDVVIVGVHGLLHERLVYVDAVDLDVIVVLLEGKLRIALVLRVVLPGAGPLRDVPVPAHVHVTGDVDPRGLEEIVHPSTILEDALHGQIIEEERTAEVGVLLGLLQGVSRAVERNEDVDDRPLLDGSVQYEIVPKEDHLEERLVEAAEDLPHRLGPGLLVHRADAQAYAVILARYRLEARRRGVTHGPRTGCWLQRVGVGQRVDSDVGGAQAPLREGGEYDPKGGRRLRSRRLNRRRGWA